MSLPAAYNTFSENRYMKGLIDTAVFPAASGYQINNGDLTVYFSGNVYPASAFGNVIAWNSGNELQNWSGARAAFAGVSLSQNNSYSTVSGQVTVATIGTFLYPVPTNSGTTIQPGTYVGFTQDPTNGQIGSGYFASQALMQASGNTTAIGKVTEPLTVNASGTGIATVQLESFLQYGGIAN